MKFSTFHVNTCIDIVIFPFFCMQPFLNDTFSHNLRYFGSYNTSGSLLLCSLSHRCQDFYSLYHLELGSQKKKKINDCEVLGEGKLSLTIKDA